MTKQEAAIISAYTGILIGNINDFKDYAEELMEEPHVWADYNAYFTELKSRSKKDFLNIKIEE